MFFRQAMPEVARWIGATRPLTYFLTHPPRGAAQGTGWAELWPEALALAGFAVGLVVLSVARFHKTIE